MSERAAAPAVRLGDEWRALCREVFSPPPPIRVSGALAEPAPEWVFEPIAEQSPDDAWLERISGMTLNGPRVPPPEPAAGFGEALRIVVELREDIARREGKRQARLQSTREAIAGRQTLAEDRRAAIKTILAKKGWNPDEPGIADALAAEIENDPLFKDKDGEPQFPVSRRTIARDLPLIRKR
jgi:hypothetical protein